MRTITVVTVARSDYGIYLPLLRRIEADPQLRFDLIVSGMHLSPEFGLTVEAIETDGFPIRDRVEMLLSSDTPDAISKSTGLGVIGYAQSYARQRPDFLFVLGDRFEMLAAVLAALPFKIPVAHLHGGELTEGAIDEANRHAITKMSHLHFAATEQYARRIIQLGEEPWRVTLSGAPSLDNLQHISLLSDAELQERFGFDLSQPTLLVTYHPVTLEYEQTPHQIQNLLDALEQIDCNIVFTYPNADTQGRLIIDAIRNFVDRHPRAQAAVNLGTQAYFSLMSRVRAMVGNSSSGIIEAASFQLPVVNIGNRQRGRDHDRNVIDVGYNRDEILNGIQTALSPEFRNQLQDLVNPYGDGHASERIVEKLKTAQVNDRLFLKKFHNITPPEQR